MTKVVYEVLLMQVTWSHAELENKVDHMMEVVRTIRSMKEEYVNTKAKAPGI